MNSKTQNRNTYILTVMVILVFIAYVAVLVKITLIKGTTLPRIVQNLQAGRAPLRALNLVPFQTIRDYIQFSSEMGFLRWFSNLAGNLFIFVPLGLYLPILFSSMRKFFRALLVIMAVSISLEALQYLFATGSTDIDDLLLNTLGGILGFGLFSCIARPGAASVTVMIRTLALSLCFAVAGYTVAYREFGIYLGLATLREEVHGGENIPARPADLTGVVTGSGAGSFTLRRFAGGEEAAEVDVLLGPETQCFDRQVSLQGHTQVINYVPCSPHEPVDIPVNAVASAWGRWDSDRLAADIVWTMRPSATQGTTMVKTAQTDTAGLALPAGESVLHGYVKSVAGDEIVITKIEKWKEGSQYFSVSTSIEQTFRLDPGTSFYKKRVLRGGKEVYLLPGARSDITERTMVQVWGLVQGDTCLAEVVCSYVFK